MIGRVLFYGAAFACNWALITGTLLTPLLKVEPGSRLNLYKSEDAGGPMRAYDYAFVKRAPQESQDTPDSKERRSQMGSSFIRFGRGRVEGNLENVDYSAIAGETADGELDSRIARGRSDVIIRFGRAQSKNLHAGIRRLTRADLVKLLDYSHNRHANKLFPQTTYRSSIADRLNNDLDWVSIVCSNMLASRSSSSSSFSSSDDDDDGDDDDPSTFNLVEPGNSYLTGKLVRLCNTLGIGIVENDENNRRAVRSKIAEILAEGTASAAAQAESAKRE